MNKTFELLLQIEDRGLTDTFVEAIVYDIQDQSEFVLEEGNALMALMKQAAKGVADKTHAPNTPLLVAEFFLGVESIDNYMEEFLNGFAIPDRE